MSDSVWPHRRQPTRLSRPWDSPGKNTGVGCYFLLQCMKVKSESEVTQSCLTLATPWTAAYQAPPSMAFSMQKYWSGVPLPSNIYINKRICSGERIWPTKTKTFIFWPFTEKNLAILIVWYPPVEYIIYLSLVLFIGIWIISWFWSWQIALLWTFSYFILFYF